jgi:salicylate hydroxylase
MPTEFDLPSMSAAAFTVAIIGGGIGGLSTALSLSTHVPDLKHITVYEQAPVYREIGAGVGIGVNAGRLLKKLGVYEQASSISGERAGLHRSLRRYDNGEEIVQVAAMDESGADGVRQLSVHRAEFLEVLYNEIRRRGCAKLETNKKAIKVEVSRPGCSAGFCSDSECAGTRLQHCRCTFRRRNNRKCQFSHR